MKKFLIGVALVAAVGAACSDARQGRTQPQANELAATTVQVTATEYSFDVPADVTGGVVEMRFTNNGAFPHEFALSRIEEGKTEADVQEALEGQAPPKWAEDIGGVPTLSPGESITVTRTLEPGSYVLLCFLPGDHGMPHALMGMYELFTVTGDAGVALPQSDAIITATDDALQVPALTTGEQTVKFENGGTEPHELALAAFESGKGIKDVDQWIEGGYEGVSPVTFLGGMQTISAGEFVFLGLDLEPGVRVHGDRLHDRLARGVYSRRVVSKRRGSSGSCEPTGGRSHRAGVPPRTPAFCRSRMATAREWRWNFVRRTRQGLVKNSSSSAEEREGGRSVMQEIEVYWYEDEVWRGYLPTDSRSSLQNKHIFKSYVAGIRYFREADKDPSFAPGSPPRLVPEPDNAYDPTRSPCGMRSRRSRPVISRPTSLKVSTRESAAGSRCPSRGMPTAE